MARMIEEPVRTFSVGFDDPRANELSWARLVADKIGAEHREVIVSPGEFFAALPRLIWHEDEPIATPASVPLHFVSRLARDHVKVVLTGEGADELFLGYNRYRVTAWNQRLGRVWEAAVPGGIRRTSALIARALPSRLRRYTDATFLARPATPRALFFDGFAVFPEAMQQSLLTDASLVRRDPHAEGLRHYGAAPGGLLERMSHADLQTYLFVPSELRRIAEEQRAGIGRHADRLWLLVNLELWQRMFLDGEDVTVAGGAASGS